MAHNVPWTSSVFFEKILSEKKLNHADEAVARQFNEQGFVVIKNVIDPALADTAVAKLSQEKYHYSHKEPRQKQAWKGIEEVKKISTNKLILDTLRTLYGREPIPFQTINFKYGSNQKTHSDSIHFHSMPERFMCGVWVALEDIHPDSGPVHYFPGSHKLPVYDYQDMSAKFLPAQEADGAFYHNTYEPFIEQLVGSHQLKKEELLIKKGDVLIWSANILHGGSPQINPDLTRWSQVTHYFFKDCLYYTPAGSNRISGEYQLRKITNMITGKYTYGSYNGREIKMKRASGHRFLISDEAGLKMRAKRLLEEVYYRFAKK